MDVQKIKVELEEKRKVLIERVARIGADKTMKTHKGPLEADWEEQAVTLQNNEVIDELDNIERKEIDQINRALAKIESGHYGTCIECDSPISEKRLEAVPYADTCMNCA